MKQHAVIGLMFGILLMAGLSRDSVAWDGERKGFLLGAGLGSGFASVRSKATFGSSSASDRMNKVPISGNAMIGFAPNNHWAIYLTEKYNYMSEQGEWAVGIFQGLATRYYTREHAKSVFLSGGIGFGSFGVLDEGDIRGRRGLGLFAGVGYEFAKHWSIEGDLTFSNITDDDFGIDLNTKVVAFMVTINVLGY